MRPGPAGEPKSPGPLLHTVTLSTLLAVTLAACTAQPHPTAEIPAPRPAAPGGVLIHLFQWPWADVARECTDVLGPAGVAGVQLSPAQEHVVLADQGFPWWQDYQPVSYRIESRRGDRAAFASMVEQCHAAGVKVYADAVINHMTAQPTGAGSAGTRFTKYEYPDLYQPTDFHPCRSGIADYADRAQVQDCELVGLADLATEQQSVRDKLTAYLNDLLRLGVDGFRIDAAKHMPAEDVRAIVAGLDRPATIYSEVLYSPTEPIQPTEYQDFGATLEPRYGDTVSRVFRSGSLTSLEDLGRQTDSPFTDLLPSVDTVVYVDSHDSQRSGALSYADGALHTLATQYMLAWEYGTPLLMSSFAYDEFDAGPPADSSGVTRAVTCPPGEPEAGSFVCEHRLTSVLAMVSFRNAVRDAPVSGWWAEADQLGFARGDRGYFALNRAAEPSTRDVLTTLPAGTYRDLLTGALIEIVGDVPTTITIPAQGVIALVPA